MRTYIQRQKLKTIADYLRYLAQSDYMGAAGRFYTKGVDLNTDAQTLDDIAESLPGDDS